MESDGSTQFTIPLDGVAEGLCLGQERAQSVIVTCPRSGVKIFEVFDRQCLKNWTCPTQLQLRGAASQDPKSRRFYAIVGPHTISSWGHNALDITSRLDHTMDSEIFCVHTPAGKRKKWSAVVVMKNESIHLLDHKMAIVASYQGPEHVVDWSHLVCIDEDDYVLTLFHNPPTGSYFLHVFSLHNEPCIRDRSRFDLRAKYTRFDDTCPLVSATFQPDRPPYLALLWANRKMNVWQWESVAHLTNSEMAPHSALRTELLELQVAPPADGSRLNRGISLFAVNPHLLLVLGYNTHEERLEVRSMHIEWNTILDLIPVALDGVDGSAVTGAVYDQEGSYIVLALPRQLCVLPLPAQRGALGDVMGSAHKPHVAEHEARKSGKKASFRTLAPLIDAGVGSALYSEGAHLRTLPHHTGRLPATFLKEFAHDNLTEYSVLQLLSDPALTPTAEDVEALFFAYVAQCAVLPLPGAEYPRGSAPGQRAIALVEEISKANKRKVSARLATAVALRCLASQFWAPLRYLLVHGLLSFSLVQDTLFSVLMEHQQIELLHISLLQLEDLDERSIVQLIKFFMDHHRAPFVVDYLRSALNLSSSSSSSLDEASSEALDGYQFLNLIVNLPINEAFTVRSLSRLETKYATNFLSYLLKYLQLYSNNPLKGVEVQLIALPVYENVLCWTTMMVDAQASSLLLAEDETMLLLAHIKREVQAQADLCEHLQPMRGWLFHVLNRLAIPSSSLQNYSIESFYA